MIQLKNKKKIVEIVGDCVHFEWNYLPYIIINPRETKKVEKRVVIKTVLERNQILLVKS